MLDDDDPRVIYSSKEDDQQEDGAWDVTEKWMAYYPPWRERLIDGRLGPEYGPTKAEFERQYKDYRDSHRGMGLWDHEEGTGKRCKKPSVRCDFAQVRRYVERNSPDISIRTLSVYCRYWVDGRSIRQTAAMLEMGDDEVIGHVSTLRRAAHKKSGVG